MKINDTRGFTLIELLVVVAIIGILASVVLASLSTARNKGNDAALKSVLANARTEAEIYYATNGNYTAVCSGGLTEFQANANEYSADVNCADDAAQWALEADLVDGTGYWCVDYTGAATNTAATSIADGSDYTCG